ncbi:MAG: V-type ATPase subunit subunit G family protein [Methanocella sp.]
MAAKSLLRQIRDKESDLDRELDQAITDSRMIVENAQREAAAILGESEQSGSAAAEEYLRKAREQTALEIAVLHENGLEQQAAVLESAQTRMSRAVEHIMNAVTLR